MQRQLALQLALQVASLCILATLLYRELAREESASTIGFTPRRTHHYDGVSDEQADVFAILDEFFPYDIVDQPFARVALGNPWPPEFRTWPVENKYRCGFILEDDGSSFRVRFLDGECALLTRTPPGTVEYRRVGFEVCDLEDHALDLARLAVPSEFWVRPGSPISPSTCVLLAARALARTHRLSDMQRVWSSLAEDFHRLHPRLVKDIENRVALDFDDPSLTWRDLLARNERCLALREDKFVRRRCDDLREIVAGRQPQTASYSVAVVARELREAMRPRSKSWDSWAVPRLEPLARDAFVEVVRRGLDVAPQLIELLDDRSPTRSIYYWTRKGSGIGVRTLGDLASEVLSVMYGNSYITEGRDVWMAFYERARATGLRDHLLSRIRTPETSSSDSTAEATDSYLLLWPDRLDDVLDAAETIVDARSRLSIVQGVLPLAGDSSARRRAIDLMRDLAEVPPPAKFVQGERDVRTAAARSLLDMGDVSGVRALLASWLRGEAMEQSAFCVLLTSGLIEPWEELERRLDTDLARRGLALVAFVGTREELLEHTTSATRPVIDDLVRRCLLKLLEDQSIAAPPERFDMYNLNPREGNWPLETTRSDVAAMALAAWWPADFEFDVHLTTTGRHRQIDAIIARTGGRVPTRPARFPGATPNDIGPVVFAEGTQSITPECAGRIRAIGGKKFDVVTLCADLEALAVWHSVAVTLHLERTGDGSGYSVVAEVDPLGPRGRRTVLCCQTADSRPTVHDPRDGVPSPPDAVELTFLWTQD